MQAQSNSGSRLVDGKRLFAHHGLSAEKAQRFDTEDFGNGVVGFQLHEVEVADSRVSTLRKVQAEVEDEESRQ